MPAPLRLTRAQVLAFRGASQSLDRRRPPGPESLRRAAWAGLQDSMPRAALLSLHARVQGVTAASWEGPPLVQLWGPRYNAYVVAEQDAAIFTLGRLPEGGATRRRAEALADRMAQALDGRRLLHGDVARTLGAPPNDLKYATLTGRVRMRWDGARQVTLWMVPRPAMDGPDARRELARRFLHVFGPSTADAFARWVGLPPGLAAATFGALGRALLPVRTPIGEEVALASDEALLRRSPDAPTGVRLLPSGDTWFLHHRADERALLVEDARLRAQLWTSRVWPGALLVNGEIVGTWRRPATGVVIEAWRPLRRAEQAAVEAEVAGLPLPRPGSAAS
jgi:hypothetical protein